MSQTPLIGVLGGMGPLATVDFLHKVVASTPARYWSSRLSASVSATGPSSCGL